MSMLRGTDARAAAAGDLDQVSPRRLGHYLKARELFSAAALRRLADEVNAGVFPGTGRTYRLDAFEFLSLVKGDVVYLDPPYAGTASYEREYAVLDELLEGGVKPVSSFSGQEPPLAELLELCASTPVLLLSYYGLNSGDAESVRALVARTHRVSQVLEVPYRHLGSIAGADRNRRNRELLIVATRD
jgi:hypothetical protein